MIRKTVFYTLALLNFMFLIWNYGNTTDIKLELRELNNTKQVFDKVELDLLDLEIIGG